ncbi:hypothetical protein AAC387_Pa08g1883 [Persea americana]|eukprot:TRINITY_DN14201_c5_g1_i1.p1 TRINITY_DN14201_c5_g1~~TRINITY_DN14201_c5_g1_i1.p1  ORF type:complete len:439 (-),score=61.05 TRINITY_DN14201_c5_g1_i1:487-1803(-)
MEWMGNLNEYEKLVIRMNTPRVVIDNAVCANATLVKIDSARKHEILLEAIQVLTDLNLTIKKAYISSDGRWFMDVFHVTDQNGNKLTDESVLSYIKQSLATDNAPKSNGFKGLTALELTGPDRQGLLSEVFAVLSDFQCNVVEAKAWTHRSRIASLIYVKDEDSGSAIEDAHKINQIEGRLKNVLKCDNSIRIAKTTASMVVTHTERRLHQMMFADHECERTSYSVEEATTPSVSVQNWLEKGYSVVYVHSKDRPKLLFDIVCVLTDMGYIIFHATIDSNCGKSYQEFHIRHKGGSPISSEAERQRVIRCLQTAIERRASEGVRLELCAADRRSLLSDVTRTFRENGLSITRAEISTSGKMAENVFYVTDVAGEPVDPKIIKALQQKIGLSSLKVKEPLMFWQGSTTREESNGSINLFSLGSIVKRNLYNLGLIRSCS